MNTTTKNRSPSFMEIGEFIYLNIIINNKMSKKSGQLPVIKPSVKKTHKSRYKKISQLGEKGKEGRTFLVTDKFGSEYAMKTFRKNKSSDKLLEEVELQRVCSNVRISPKIVDYDLEEKFVVMEKMDCHLLDKMKQVGGLLTENQQAQLLDIFKKLDKAGVFQGDANILNYMIRDGRIYIIDFGFAERIDDKLIKKVKSGKPNSELMLLGLILKLKEMHCPPASYSILKNALPADKRLQFGI
jgi:predicted Ser/Thr protein kinase